MCYNKPRTSKGTFGSFRLHRYSLVHELYEYIFLAESTTYVHPKEVSVWDDDMKCWAPVEKPDIVFYLLHSKACDLQDVKAYKSLDSYQYLTAGLVGMVHHHRINGDLAYYKAEVGRSQSFNASPHKAWVCVHKSGRVVTGGCSCMAGKARVCSHVGAILWKMEYAFSNNMTGIACTDEAATWNRGTKRNVTPASLENIAFGSEQGEEINGAVQTLAFESHEDYVDHVRNSPLAGLMDIPGTLFHITLTAAPLAPLTEAVECEVLPPIVKHNSHEDVGILPESCPACWEVYSDLVNVSAAGAELLCSRTAQQGESSLWHESRRMRLTSSMVKRVPVRPSTDHTKAVMDILHPSFRGNRATERGRRNEPRARREFARRHQCTVRQTGLVICPALPWLAASPDGVIDSENALVEIKCPDVDDCSTLLGTRAYDLQKNDDETYTLLENGRNKYYHQVQFAMHCTGKSTCYLYVWSEEHDMTAVVPYNRDFVNSHLSRLHGFYFKSLLPTLVNDLHSGKVNISDQYRCLVKVS